MSKYTAKGLVDFCIAKANKVETMYVLGSFGQNLTSAYLDQSCKRLPWNQENRNVLQQYADKGWQCYDCCGLIKAYLWDDNPANYKTAQDRSDAMMFNDARIKGPISTMPEKPGVLVFMAGHVGVYVGNGRVVECTPSQHLGGWGVLNTAFAGRGWTTWAEHIDIDYGIEVQPQPEQKPTPSPVPSAGDQWLYPGSIVRSERVFKISAIDVKNDLVASTQLTGVTTKPHHWLPSGPITTVYENGTRHPNQVLFVGSYGLLEGEYKVKAIDVPTQSALINVGGGDVWIYSRELFEVRDR